MQSISWTYFLFKYLFQFVIIVGAIPEIHRFQAHDRCWAVDFEESDLICFLYRSPVSPGKGRALHEPEELVALGALKLEDELDLYIRAFVEESKCANKAQGHRGRVNTLVRSKKEEAHSISLIRARIELINVMQDLLKCK